MKFKITFLFLSAFLNFSGCAIVQNLDELLTLNSYSHETDSQHRLVKSVNTRYEALNKAIDEGHIGQYKTKESFVQAFGEPLIKKKLGKSQERWLYRHPIHRLAKDKIYLYFDHDGKLVKWEKLPCSKFS